MKQDYGRFFDMVESSGSIVIFGHVYPDGDCYGSTEGLKAALSFFYPDKKVFVSNTDYKMAPDDFPRADIVSDSTVADSLHIICDIGDKARLGDKRALGIEGKGIIKIDHHIKTDDFGGLEMIDTERASTCDYLASVFYSRFRHLPPLAASLFFLGLTTDTGRFQFAYSGKVFGLAARLIKDGADVQHIYNAIDRISEKSIRFRGWLFSNYRRTFFGVSYCFVPFKASSEYGYDSHAAALFVNSIGNIEASRLFAVISETADGKAYCEFRSKGSIDVQKIAKSFGGGGHLNASGCLLDDYGRREEVIRACEQVLIDSYKPYGAELEIMVSLAQKASSAVMDYYQHGFEVQTKEDNSPVTSADKASDRLIRDALAAAFPSYGILTEEDADDFSRLRKDKVFIIDPLDGTADYVAKDNMFSINIALADKHLPAVGVVAVPFSGDIYFAVKGYGSYAVEKGKMIKRMHVSYRKENIRALTSVFHQSVNLAAYYRKHCDKIIETKPIGSSLKACLIADGKAEICYSLGHGTKEWDTCAPQLIVEEAGGVYADNHLRPILYNRENVYNEDGYTVLNDRSNAIDIDEVLNGK